ncbi:MAG: UDP-N-acetylglucosamine 1-carboxyvinyltransferase [Bacteriovoracaceae bacterium]|jgi:UDP-N-acetylglucosamine 1-carboxyvinyltransferase|nr:UDP-N-acetylglucosamine 1-carboxyvinyltransferase [Bacteriovoracaceae bacterium]
MDKLIVEGKAILNGSVKVSGAKNASLPIMAACLLFPRKVNLQNLPGLSDVNYFKKILTELGGVVDKDSADCSSVDKTTADYDLVRKMRASVLVLGPLLSRFKKATVSLPGGCAIGSRPVDLHIEGMKALGANIEIKNGYIHASCDELIGSDIYLKFASVGATENILMAAVYAKGTTRIFNYAKEPEVIDLIDFLNTNGAKVTYSDECVVIEGIEVGQNLTEVSYSIIGDRIEAATFIIAALITKGEVEVTGFNPLHIDAVLIALKKMGALLEVKENGVLVKKYEKLKPIHIKTDIHPGFPTDVQAQMMALLGLVEGESSVEETIFENRFMHVPELSRMGYDISINGAKATINGVKKATAAPVMCTDLRASAALILAGLTCEKDTHVARVYHLDRGYENIEEKFNGLGSTIKRVSV